MKIGIDVHGVITKHPKIFSNFCKLLLDKGHEIHIITGQELGPRLINFLDTHKIKYTNLFSITSYHKEIGTLVVYKGGDVGQPLIDEELWNKTKADYCKGKEIDIHIDDSWVYGKYFDGKTIYLRYTKTTRNFLTLLTNSKLDTGGA